jgi:oxygen-independent coproporphyrinogen-3 oxidase
MPAGAEISIECNPDPALCEGFALYREAGISRISFGVQSFVPRELKILGRRHRADDIETAVRRARAAGFVDISLDLMFGVPGQSLATLDRSIDAALDLDVPHLSAYGLTIEEGTPFERWRAREPGLFGDEAWEAELYGRLITRLQAAGYEQYELSNFARPGHRCRHNAQYWNNDEYAGFGLGAASYRNGVRSIHTKEFDLYVEAVEHGREIPGEAEELNQDARIGEAIMLALRRSEGVDGGSFAARYQVEPAVRYSEVIARFSEAGLLESDGAGFRLTASGRFLANEVCAAFLKTVP